MSTISQTVYAKLMFLHKNADTLLNMYSKHLNTDGGICFFILLALSFNKLKPTKKAPFWKPFTYFRGNALFVVKQVEIVVVNQWFDALLANYAASLVAAVLRLAHTQLGAVGAKYKHYIVLFKVALNAFHTYW